MSYTTISLIGPRRMRTVALMLIAIVLLMLGQVSVTPAAASPSPYRPQNGPIVRCDPATASGILNEDDVVVDMYIQDVVGLYGADLRVSFFDTSIVQVVDQSTASGVQIQPRSDFLQPDYVARNTADNTNGTIRYAATQTAPNLPVDGSGPVARITFHGLKVGVFTMTWGLLELSDIDGRPILATGQPCEIRILSPLAVTLAGFAAAPQGADILTTWETVSEIDNAGFNLYRSDAVGGPQMRLNKALIPSRAPGGTGGAVYSWLDRGCMRGTTHFYWLESVDLGGQPAIDGPVSATCGAPMAVSLGSLDASRQGFVGVSTVLLVSLAAVLYGMRRRRRVG